MQVIWVCILCRKKQELLSKTGEWIKKPGLTAGDNAMLRRMQDMQVGGPPGLVDQTQDKRPKLERAHSAAEKENLPLLLRSGSLLRRQYSQQEQVRFTSFIYHSTAGTSFPRGQLIALVHALLLWMYNNNSNVTKRTKNTYIIIKKRNDYCAMKRLVKRIRSKQGDSRWYISSCVAVLIVTNPCIITYRAFGQFAFQFISKRIAESRV